MFAIGRVTKFILGAASAAVIVGCSQVHFTQDAGVALVRMGPYDSSDHGGTTSEQVAGHFAPYALMVYAAYQAPVSGKASGWMFDGLVDAKGRDASETARAWMAEWKPLDMKNYREGPLECTRNNGSHTDCLFPVSGLAYQIWAKKDCSEVVIAFRGTNFSETNDWITNLHWFLRLLPLHDQYEQVQDHAAPLASAMAEQCPGASPKLIAVGHSLGGGLAQQLAYMDTPVRRVYAFNPSFVTGFYDRHSKSEASAPHVEIDRVFEHGEILAYPRFILRQIIPFSACNPEIRAVRFDFVNKNVIFDHKSGVLAANIINAAGTPAQWAARKDKFRLPRGSEADPKECAPRSPS